MNRILIFTAVLITTLATQAGRYALTVEGNRLLLNGTPIKIIGLRLSNALISDGTTDQLIHNLDVFKRHGINSFSVFLMGSRFGDVKGYRPDASLDPVYAARLARVIEAADARGMVVLVGCLYWSTSRAKEDLKAWKQEDANRAIAKTVAWLSTNNYRNVFVDVDNEGMAHASTQWDIGEMIDAGHAVDPKTLLAYNCKEPPPANADVLIHHSPKDHRRPYVETEGSPYEAARGGYWGRYSKQDTFYNYIRIGRYTPEMKAKQLRDTHAAIEQFSGYMMASTWLQCVAGEGVGGPFMTPGGLAENLAVDEQVTRVQNDSGILWWLLEMKKTYVDWKPPR